MHGARRQALQIGQASPDDYSEALLLAYRSLPAPECVEKMAATIAAARRGELSLDGLWTARRGERTTGALLVQPMPGKTALIWPPQLTDGEPESTAMQLLSQALDWLRRGDVRVGQAMLTREAQIDARRLAQAGFAHAADLLFMYCRIDEIKTNPPTRALTFEPFAESEYDRLARLVEKTYEDSLDCPAIDKLRKIDDVLEGYRLTGQFSPEQWMFVRCDQQDIGCLLLADHAAQQQWELVYMGLVRQARGRGLGLQIVRQAQRMAAQAQRKVLLLAVDAANDPAIRVYSAAGFTELFQRRVFLRAM